MESRHLPHFLRDKDADDVEQYARDHEGNESPTEDAKGEKRGPEGDPDDELAEKYLRFPPLPLGMDDDDDDDDVGGRRPVTPEVKLPMTPRQGDPVLDDSEVQEPQSKSARTQPDSSPSTGLYPPQYAGNISRIYVNNVRYQ